jgi:hypothetical protein
VSVSGKLESVVDIRDCDLALSALH